MVIRRLLVKVIKRAILDWVHYKGSKDKAEMHIALDAYFWLFIEKPGCDAWDARVRDGNELTSFLVLCHSLDLDPEAIRRGVKVMTKVQARKLEREFSDQPCVTNYYNQSPDSLPAHVDMYDLEREFVDIDTIGDSWGTH